jgi:hypothetical protein
MVGRLRGSREDDVGAPVSHPDSLLIARTAPRGPSRNNPATHAANTTTQQISGSAEPTGADAVSR